MKKISSITILIIYIVAFNITLISCGSMKNKSDSSENNSSTTSNSNGTSTTNSSTAQSGDTIKSIDYNQYIKKVWIVKSWTKGAYYYSSFCISKIANGKIEGKISTEGIVVPSQDYYLPNDNGFLGGLTGEINNDTAECQFSDKDGDKGNVKLVFKTDDEIEANIEYTDKSQSYKNLSQEHKDLSLDGTLLFKPYNIKDVDGFSPFKDQSFTVDLNSWGSVKFVSGKLIGGQHIPTLFYLTNNTGDILYDFGAPFPYNVDVKATSFQDVNKDGLKDIIIIVYDKNDSSLQLAKVFFQKADGSFENDGKLDQEINDSGNNKDIKAVTDYLSKKF